MRDRRVGGDGLLVVVPGNFWSSMGVGGFALFARGGPASWWDHLPPGSTESFVANGCVRQRLFD